MRLVIFCEGDTEATVLKKGFGFLDEYVQRFSTVIIRNYRGSGNFKTSFVVDAKEELQNSPETFVFGLIDLLNSPINKFPPRVENAADPYKAEAAFIKKYFEDQLDDESRTRCFVFPVVMEIETWLLADEEAMGILAESPHPVPEEVREPVQYMKSLWKKVRDSGYVKPNSSVELFKRAKATRIYADNCPHFNAIIDKLRELQGEATEPQRPLFEVRNQQYIEIYNKIMELDLQIHHLLDEKILVSLAQSEQDARWKEATQLDEQIKALRQKLRLL